MAQGSSDSFIGMAHRKQRFDDAGYNPTKNGNPKSKKSSNGSKKESLRNQQRQERDSRYG